MPGDTTALATARLQHTPEAFTILVAANDRATIDMVTQSILGPRGYRTQTALTGRQALSRIRQAKPDLLLVEWRLPDMQADALLQAVLDSGRRIPSIIVADPQTDLVSPQVFRLGARDYLSKPLDPGETIQAVRRVLTGGWGQRQQAHQLEALGERMQGIYLLDQLSQSILATQQRDRLLGQIVDAALKVTAAEEGFLLLADAAGENLELRAMRGLDDPTPRLVRYPTRETAAWEVFRNGRPIRSGGQEPEGAELRTGYLVKGVIHVPVVAAGRTLGVLSVDRKVSSELFSAEDEEMLVRLAGWAGAALENARRLAQVSLAWQQRTGRAQQVLQRLGRYLQQLESITVDPNPAQRELIQEMKQLLQEAAGLLVPPADPNPG